MAWVALKMLTGDRAKFAGIVTGLTFAARLITQQGSIFCGIMLRTAAQISDISGADLWVMDRNVRCIDDVKPMIEDNLYRVRGVDGVLWAVPLFKGQAQAKVSFDDRATGARRDVIETVILLGLDDVSLVGMPRHLYIGRGFDLWTPDGIVVDKVGLRTLFPGQGGESARTDEELEWFIGRALEMNDRRAVIVGICETTRTFQSNPVVYTTYPRALSFTPQPRMPLTYILAKAEPGQDPALVAQRIEARTGLGAKTSDEFQWMTIKYDVEMGTGTNGTRIRNRTASRWCFTSPKRRRAVSGSRPSLALRLAGASGSYKNAMRRSTRSDGGSWPVLALSSCHSGQAPLEDGRGQSPFPHHSVRHRE